MLLKWYIKIISLAILHLHLPHSPSHSGSQPERTVFITSISSVSSVRHLTIRWNVVMGSAELIQMKGSELTLAHGTHSISIFWFYPQGDKCCVCVFVGRGAVSTVRHVRLRKGVREGLGYERMWQGVGEGSRYEWIWHAFRIGSKRVYILKSRVCPWSNWWRSCRYRQERRYLHRIWSFIS